MSVSRPDAGKAGTTHVSFVCQKCFQPLKLDHSFNTIEQKQITELTGQSNILTVHFQDLNQLTNVNIVIAWLTMFLNLCTQLI